MDKSKLLTSHKLDPEVYIPHPSQYKMPEPELKLISERIDFRISYPLEKYTNSFRLAAVRCPAGLAFDIFGQTCNWKAKVDNCDRLSSEWLNDLDLDPLTICLLSRGKTSTAQPEDRRASLP